MSTSALPSVATTSSANSTLCLSCGPRWIVDGAAAPESLNALPNVAASLASIGSPVSLVTVPGGRRGSRGGPGGGWGGWGGGGRLAWTVPGPDPATPADEK